MENISDISDKYMKHYKTLLKTREPDNESEKIIEEVNKKFQEITRKTNQIESTADEMVKKAIAKLKNKRASDRLRWRVERLKEEGEEIVKSLSVLFNRIKENKQHSYKGGKQQSKIYIKVVIRTI